MAAHHRISFSTALRDLRGTRAIFTLADGSFALPTIMACAVAKARLLARMARLTWRQAMAVTLKGVWAQARAEAERFARLPALAR